MKRIGEASANLRTGTTIGGASTRDASSRPTRWARSGLPGHRSGDDGDANDLRIGEHVELVATRAGELGHHRALRAGLEPVQRVRRDGELLARREHELRESIDVETYA